MLISAFLLFLSDLESTVAFTDASRRTMRGNIDLFGLRNERALNEKRFQKYGKFWSVSLDHLIKHKKTCTAQMFRLSCFGELPEVVLPKIAQKRQKLP